ncbi:hypothetical protein ACHQM5_019835 [Ranunculus cassubicifolius]
MRPTELPKQSIGKNKSTARDAHVTIMSSNVNCPQGTVPIRRTLREDLIRAKAFRESFSSNIHTLTGLTPGKHQAIVRSIFNPKYTYKGIEGTISVYNPVVGIDQTATAQIWIEKGPRNTRNSLQAGWMVAPNLYGDNKTHWFGYWSVQGNSPQGCFNHLCLGFVQVDQNQIPGSAIHEISDERTQYNIDFQIFQDSKTGDWWLRAPNVGANIGYWPKSLLPGLSNGASTVIWGGQTLGERYGASPGMGNGRVIDDGDFRHACYVENMKLVDPTFFVLPPAGPKYQTEIFVDNTECYKLEKYGYNGQERGYSFLFGGPGGNNCGA